MLKMSVVLRMVLTIVLIILPVGIISFFFSKNIFKKMTRLLGKIDTFDALTRFKNEIVHLYKKRFAKSYVPPVTDTVSYEQKTEQKIDATIDEIINPNPKNVKHHERDLIIPDEEGKMTMIKKRKLLEKIIYDAL